MRCVVEFGSVCASLSGCSLLFPDWIVFGRGIDVVRNRIKMFAQKKVTLPSGRHKIIILDEADRWRAHTISVSVILFFHIHLIDRNLFIS